MHLQRLLRMLHDPSISSSLILLLVTIAEPRSLHLLSISRNQFRLTQLLFSDTLYQATCFGPPGPSSGLYPCLNTDPHFLLFNCLDPKSFTVL
jgi:hypothetical protein